MNYILRNYKFIRLHWRSPQGVIYRQYYSPNPKQTSSIRTNKLH